MKLSDGVVQPIPLTGICQIDVKKIAKCFGFSTISRWNEDYRLVNKRAHIKLTISKKDAMELKEILKLIDVPSGLFGRASTLMTKARAEKLYGVGCCEEEPDENPKLTELQMKTLLQVLEQHNESPTEYAGECKDLENKVRDGYQDFHHYELSALYWVFRDLGKTRDGINREVAEQLSEFFYHPGTWKGKS